MRHVELARSAPVKVPVWRTAKAMPSSASAYNGGDAGGGTMLEVVVNTRTSWFSTEPSRKTSSPDVSVARTPVTVRLATPIPPSVYVVVLPGLRVRLPPRRTPLLLRLRVPESEPPCPDGARWLVIPRTRKTPPRSKSWASAGLPWMASASRVTSAMAVRRITTFPPARRLGTAGLVSGHTAASGGTAGEHKPSNGFVGKKRQSGPPPETGRGPGVQSLSLITITSTL